MYFTLANYDTRGTHIRYKGIQTVLADSDYDHAGILSKALFDIELDDLEMLMEGGPHAGTVTQSGEL